MPYSLEEFLSLSPDQLYLYLTGNVLYYAVRNNNQKQIDSVLSCFDADARRELCIGLACLRAMRGGDEEYSTALRHALASVLYEEMKERKCTT